MKTKKKKNNFRQLAVLFGVIELKQARKILINSVADMETRCEELSQVATIVREINAWDLKRVDQPDFEKRLDAFKKVKLLADEDKLHVDLALIVLHNCFYFVRCVSYFILLIFLVSSNSSFKITMK